MLDYTDELFTNAIAKLVWLASYPKSGNTWFRIFLTNYLQNTDHAANINHIIKTPLASHRHMLDSLYGIDSSDLDGSEIEQRRPAMYDEWRDDPNFLFHKIHDAYTYLPNNQPLLGNPTNQAAIYFIRNPLDVVVSSANHNATDDIDKIIGHITDDNHSICKNNSCYLDQFVQKFLSWSGHVQSWQKAPIKLVIIRYEDMLENPVKTFAQAIQFLGLPLDQDRLEKAIAFSSFDLLNQQEQIAGFNEKPSVAKKFFNQGKAGRFSKVLTHSQIARVIEANKAVMEEFGYLK